MSEKGLDQFFTKQEVVEKVLQKVEFNDFSTFKDQFSEAISDKNPLRNNIKDGIHMFNHHLA